jgi:hypothetical protein
MSKDHGDRATSDGRLKRENVVVSGLAAAGDDP